MIFYHITEEPIKIYGLAIADREKRQFWRLRPEIMEKCHSISSWGKGLLGGASAFGPIQSIYVYA